jgi:hypothetical protein
VKYKTCTKCGEVKEIGVFRANARYADGYVNWCDGCSADYRRSHYEKNKEKVRKQNAEWHAANKSKRNAGMRAAYRANPKAHSARVTAAKKRRPEHYREMANRRQNQRRADSVEIRLRSRISSQIRYCLNTGKGGKTTQLLLGYSIPELRDHLSRQFVRGMGWHNMGEWHIDHIVPLASFKITGADDPELRRAWALTNLRPLWAEENIRKRASNEFLL